MDIGRNEPCPCGSGKKYKRCCGAPKTDPLELAAGAIRATQDSAETKVVRLIRRELGDNAFGEAWGEFGLAVVDLDPERDEQDLFVPWVLFDWEPWEAARHVLRPLEVRMTPAAAALAGRGTTLSAVESAFLLGVVGSPTSFHEVIESEPGRTATLRDIFLGSEATVFEKLGSKDVRPGDILYGRVVKFDDVALMIGSGQLVIPPRDKGIVLDAKATLRRRPGKLCAEKLCREETLLRSLYLELRERIVHPARPEIRNTDGHPMEFHTITYRINDPEAALRALAPLAYGEDPEQLVATAKRDWRGTLRGASFPWSRARSKVHGGAPNTTLADFTINGTKLTVHVNSAERATALRDELARRLGTQATLVRDDVEPLDATVTKGTSKREAARDKIARQRDEELQALPEVQAMLAKFNADHYATWPDVPLPALKGRTPRAAMRSKDGRERVEALLADFERSQDDRRHATPRYDFNLLRAALGLPLRNP